VRPARKVRQTRFVIDGEAVVLGVDGIADFDALHSRKHDDEVQLYAFDILALDGDDLRRLPLSLRKTNLARLPARRPDGIFVARFEQGEIGPDLFRKACEFGFEGLVSKHRNDHTVAARRSIGSRSRTAASPRLTAYWSPSDRANAKEAAPAWRCTIESTVSVMGMATLLFSKCDALRAVDGLQAQVRVAARRR
jgi:hypothetical protein